MKESRSPGLEGIGDLVFLCLCWLVGWRCRRRSYTWRHCASPVDQLHFYVAGVEILNERVGVWYRGDRIVYGIGCFKGDVQARGA